MRYVRARLVRFLFTVWLGATVIFFVPRLSRSDPTDAIIGQLLSSGAGVENADAIIEAYKQRFGLDDSIWVQYGRYLANLFRFDNGYSVVEFPTTVDSLVLSALPWTLGLMGAAIVISFLVGNLTGTLLGWERTPRWVGRVLTVPLVFTALPAFMVGLLLINVFSYNFGWLPPTGAYDPSVDPGWSVAFALSVIEHAVLPVTAVVMVTMGGWALGMRGMMITTAGEEYVRLAEAKGLRSSRVLFNYQVRNAILPQITRLGITLGLIASGFVVIERVFNYPGIGMRLFRAVTRNDYPVIQGVAWYLVLGVALAVLVVDLIYPLIDPRISYRSDSD
ncbi:MAG: ABC transporter permease [Acidimicrobiaceae bacterium]|nr:ABC transporter permease [Acidimicrobiaceae bacterium]